MKMIKTFKVVLLIMFSLNCFSQPGFKRNAIIQIQSIYKERLRLFKTGDDRVKFKTLYFVNTKGLDNVAIRTVGEIENDFYKMIYEKDTMQVKIVLPEYYRLSDIRIKQFNFIKGNYTIDLLKFIENTDNIEYGNLIINNFPEDCLPYRKEEKE